MDRLHMLLMIRGLGIIINILKEIYLDRLPPKTMKFIDDWSRDSSHWLEK